MSFWNWVDWQERNPSCVRACNLHKNCMTRTKLVWLSCRPTEEQLQLAGLGRTVQHTDLLYSDIRGGAVDGRSTTVSIQTRVCVWKIYIWGVVCAGDNKRLFGIPTKGTTLKPYIRIGERKKTMGNSKESIKITVKWSHTAYKVTSQTLLNRTHKFYSTDKKGQKRKKERSWERCITLRCISTKHSTDKCIKNTDLSGNAIFFFSSPTSDCPTFEFKIPGTRLVRLQIWWDYFIMPFFFLYSFWWETEISSQDMVKWNF